MSIRNALFAAMFVSVAVAPALAGQPPAIPGGEAGYIEPAPQLGASLGGSAERTPARIVNPGDASADSRYVFAGAEAGWIAKTHFMLVQGGRLVHGDDCVHAAAKPVLGLDGGEKQLLAELQIGG